MLSVYRRPKRERAPPRGGGVRVDKNVYCKKKIGGCKYSCR